MIPKYFADFAETFSAIFLHLRTSSIGVALPEVTNGDQVGSTFLSIDIQSQKMPLRPLTIIGFGIYTMVPGAQMAKKIFEHLL